MSLSVKNLSAGYGSEKVLEDINFEITNNEVVGLIGSNGCGKTTLIKSICGIIPSVGEIYIDGTDASNLSTKEFAQKCSLVPQRSGIGIEISSLDVVLMGYNPFLSFMGSPKKEMVKKAIETLEMLGLADKVHDNFLSLSEGQKQLVIIARALVANSSVLLMDEPESSLDFSVRYEFMKRIRNLISKTDRCALISLHDINLALNYCDKLLLINEKKIAGIINPGKDSIDEMTQKLSELYGSISIQRFENSSGESQLVMVKD